MRKSTKIISGVIASFGVALAPLATFAVSTPTRTDHLKVTLSESCTVNNANLSSETVDLHNYYEASVTAGNTASFGIVDGTGKSPAGAATEQIFTIKCNNAAGYRVMAAATDPTGQEEANTGVTIPAGTAISGNESYWAATISTTGNLDAVSDQKMALGNSTRVAYNEAGSATNGDTFTVAYEVGASTALKAGTYAGQVVYTVLSGAE